MFSNAPYYRRAGKTKQILRCGWLPERERWSHLARPELLDASRKAISFIDQVCSVKMAGYCPRSFFCEFMDLDFVSVHKHAKKELGQYPAILTWHLVNNPYVLTTPEKFENATPVILDLCLRKTGAGKSCDYRDTTIVFKMFSSTLTRKAGVFKFFRCEERFRKAPCTGPKNVTQIIVFLVSRSEAWKLKTRSGGKFLYLQINACPPFPGLATGRFRLRWFLRVSYPWKIVLSRIWSRKT